MTSSRDTDQPAWAVDVMNDDDIAFIEGYIDAIGWLPTAEPREMANLLSCSEYGGIFFEMTEDHSLARYKGYTNHPDSEIVGIYGATFNNDGTEIGYTAGISAALRIHRPDVARAVRRNHLTFRRKMIQDCHDQRAEYSARDQAELARIDAELAELEDVTS